MGKRKPYNGHESWAAWNVSLWIMNDEHTYREARRFARMCDNSEDAAELLREQLPRETPDGAVYSQRSVTLVMRALRRYET